MPAVRNLPPKQPLQRRSQETVRAVLQAGAYILVEHGHERASTNAIAERAGVNIGSLYQYFPNKQAIFTAIAEEHFQGYAAHMLGASQRSFRVSVARSFSAYLETRPRSELRPRAAAHAAHVSVLVVDALTQDALLSAQPFSERALTRQIADVLRPYLVG